MPSSGRIATFLPSLCGGSCAGMAEAAETAVPFTEMVLVHQLEGRLLHPDQDELGDAISSRTVSSSSGSWFTRIDLESPRYPESIRPRSVPAGDPVPRRPPTAGQDQTP